MDLFSRDWIHNAQGTILRYNRRHGGQPRFAIQSRPAKKSRSLIENVAAVLEKPSGFEQLNVSLFSLEGGIIAPLSVLAIRYRNLVVRRQAISLLKKTSYKEGRWESLARVAV